MQKRLKPLRGGTFTWIEEWHYWLISVWGDSSIQALGPTNATLAMIWCHMLRWTMPQCRQVAPAACRMVSNVVQLPFGHLLIQWGQSALKVLQDLRRKKSDFKLDLPAVWMQPWIPTSHTFFFSVSTDWSPVNREAADRQRACEISSEAARTQGYFESCQSQRQL